MVGTIPARTGKSRAGGIYTDCHAADRMPSCHMEVEFDLQLQWILVFSQSEPGYTNDMIIATI